MHEPIPLHEALARHEGFVRSLARRLARDPDEADDVTQETWLRVLERATDGPAGLVDRLARTVRTVAGSRRRAERRRGERERRVAAGERETDPARIEEALERHRAVVDEVLALDEPLRHVVLLRHREGHGVAEVARLLAVPVETVRTRQKRAYALLRRRLERRFGGQHGLAATLLLVADGPGAETAVGAGVGWTATAALVLAAAGAAVAGVRLVERETLVEGAPALAPVERGAGPPASAPSQATTAAGSTALGREPVVAPAPLDPFWEAVRAARRGAPRLRLQERLAPEDAALLEALRTHDLAGYHAPAEPWADRVRDLARRSGLPLEVDPASQDVDGTAPDLALVHPIAVGDLLELAVASSRRLRWALRDGAVVVGREGRVRGPLLVAGPSIADLRIDPDDFHVTGAARKDLFPRISPEDVLQLVREASDAAAWDREDALLAWGGSVDDLLRDVPGDLGVALDARGLAAGEVFVACNEAPALAPLEETLDALRAFWLPDPEAGTPGAARPWLAAAPASPRYREHLERLAAIRFELPPTTRTLGAAAGELARAAALDVWVAPELRARPVAPDPTTRSASEWLRAWTEPDGLAWDAAHGLVRILPDHRAARGALLGLFDLRELLDGAGRIADLDVGPVLDPAEWPPEDVLTGDVLDAWLRDTLAPASWEANPAYRLRVIDAAGVLVLWQSPEAQAEAARRFDAIQERRGSRR